MPETDGVDAKLHAAPGIVLSGNRKDHFYRNMDLWILPLENVETLL